LTGIDVMYMQVFQASTHIFSVPLIANYFMEAQAPSSKEVEK